LFVRIEISIGCFIVVYPGPKNSRLELFSSSKKFKINRENLLVVR